MSGRTVPLLLVPRFTTYVREGEFASMGIDIAPFASAVVHAWRGKLIGTTPSVSFRFEESMERDSWSTCDGGSAFSPSEGVVETKTLAFRKRFLRVVVALAGTDVAVTAHVFGHLVPRDEAEG